MSFVIDTIIAKNKDNPIKDEEENDEYDRFINTIRVNMAVTPSV